MTTSHDSRTLSQERYRKMDSHVPGSGLKIERTEQIVKRHEFVPWAERQGRAPRALEDLIHMVQQAPQAVTVRMQPRGLGTPGAVFTNHHIIVAGRKE